MATRLRIIVACKDGAGVRIIKAILSAGHDIIGLLLPPSDNSASSAFRFATESGIQTWPAANAGNEIFAETVVREKVDLILSVRFPVIFCARVIGAPRLGAFNLHTGPLPQYAGLNVSNWAIYNGENQHGVTLHKIVSAIDAGPIVDQALFDIEPEDTGLTLTIKCINFGLLLIVQFLEKASQEEVVLVHQDLKLQKYYTDEIPQKGYIQWERPAQRLFDFIRACDFYPLISPWGTPQAILGDKAIYICKCSMTNISSEKPPGSIRITPNLGVEVATQDNWLRIDLIRYKGQYLEPVKILRNRARLENGRAALVKTARGDSTLLQ